MKTLVAEDDFTSRLVLQKFLQAYGEVHIAVNGKEAVDAFRLALDDASPYDLICLDIMMPEMDGFDTLMMMRRLEQERGISPMRRSKIFMTTTVDALGGVKKAFYALCDAYLVKPIAKVDLLKEIHSFGLMDPAPSTPDESYV